MNARNNRLRKRNFALAETLIGLITIQSMALAQPQFTSLHSFNGTDGFGPMVGVVEGSDGALYGTTSGQVESPNVGTVFRLDRTTIDLTTLHYFSDGSRPFSTVTLGSDGMLYGTTFSGGDADLGTLFRVGSDGQSFALLYSFSGTDGAKPDDLGLLQSGDGAFYGATSEGGPDGGGTLFQFDAATQTLTTRYSFVPTGAGGVDAGLIVGRDGYWYGTTYSGGANGAGSVFRVDPSTFELTTLHDFSGTDGANPVPGALMQGSDGNLYGTTQLGGNGKVYKLNPTTRVLTTLHTFSGISDGRFPLGGVTEGGDGYLYGTTILGGQGYGTIYRVHPTTLAYNIVVPFGGANGRSPSGNLFRASDGALYGTTRLGGSFNFGTVFRLSFAIPCAIDAQCSIVDSNVCTCNQCSMGFCTSTPIEYGNVNCSATQPPSLDDILYVLADFADGGAVTHPSSDIAPACTGNGLLNLDDILAVVAAFGGADPCNCMQ